MKVLYLSVSIGAGHIKAAEAIKESIERKYPDSKNLILDTLRYINPIVDKLVVNGYLNTIRNTPKLYKLLYEFSETGENINEFSKVVNRILSFKIKKLIAEFNPSIIICTHPFPLQMMSTLNKKGVVKIPTIGILTDYSVHPIWLHDNIDAFVVAHEYMKYEIIKKGFSENLLYPVGIPVASKFIAKHEKTALLKKLNLDDKLTFLLIGGSLGFGEIKDIFFSLIDNDADFQLIVVTGRNKKLKNHLSEHKKCNKKIKIFSYTNKIEELMEVSDFIITKPGGMTIAESLVKGLPLFLISPIPGQEERNAQFLVNSGVAARILKPEDINIIFHQIIGNPLRVQQMKEMAMYLSKPNACDDIIRLIEKLLIEST